MVCGVVTRWTRSTTRSPARSISITWSALGMKKFWSDSANQQKPRSWSPSQTKGLNGPR